ncbi:Atp1b1p [Cichlidogyrus casuarinus]|uniref:Atp1b1p n=1 Tax=Cichlidogyrus casuarinus TaxID=1844966 RepID=A0ABD2QDH6_9PLAT
MLTSLTIFQILAMSNRRNAVFLFGFITKDLGNFSAELGNLGLIFLFYLIFFTLLCGFFIGMMAVNLIYVIPKTRPLLTGKDSLLKLSPGLGMRPMPDSAETLIRYSSNSPQTYKRYVQGLDLFLKDYYDINAKNSVNFATCDGKKQPDDIHKVCKFPIDKFGDCTQKNNYGYSSNKPCILLKLNKIYGWLPDPTDATIKDPLVKCTGQNPQDTENLGTPTYYPSVKLNETSYGSFSNLYYPYVGQKSYLAPVVMVKFDFTRTSIPILVKCEVHNFKTSTDVDPVTMEFLVD